MERNILVSNDAGRHLDDELLLVEGDGLQGLLYHAAAVHLQGQGLHVGPQLKGKNI